MKLLSINVLASGFMMLAMLGFVFNDLIIKSLDGTFPVGQIMLLRGVFLSVLLLVILWHQQMLLKLRDVMIAPVLARSFCDGCSTLFFLNALHQLPFANLSALLQFLPMAVTFGAWLFLEEQVGWRRWCAILIGLVGVLIIIQPGLNGFNSASLLMLGTVVFAAARDLLTRKIPDHLPSMLITFATVFATTSLGFVMTVSSNNWQSVAGSQWLVFAGAAFFLFFGHHFIVLAMRKGDIAYVAPFRYTGLVMGILLAWFFYDELPGAMTLLGSCIVVVTGLYTMYRELALKSKAAMP